MTNNKDQLLSSYDYQLPEELIAQNPVIPRHNSRLLVVDSPHSCHHQIFKDLPQFLNSGDLLILNNTQVIPARLYGTKTTGAPVEILLLEKQEENYWLALVKPGKRFKLGVEISFGEVDNIPIKATVMGKDEATGGRFLKFDLPPEVSFWYILEQLGKIPLPPYITDSQCTPAQYQTVYAQNPGAVAAPTAGLHFTPELLQTLKDKNIPQAYITLHVGLGTFRPLEIEDITNHEMHQEWIDIPSETVAKIEETKAQGGRIIAVGTTVVRALEGASQSGQLKPFCGKTNLFIYPGYEWKTIDGMITNFHLPKSSLLMLVSALITRERLLNLYQEAIKEKYRFYSFGDGMLILPSARL
jgi:S-adenosylmethionine:tRNA ribosyltransferase-isomerase